MIFATSRLIFRPLPFANCHIFSDSSLSWSVKYSMHGRKTFITRHSVIQIIPRMRAAIVVQELCSCWPLRFDTPCTWNYYLCHLSSRRVDLRLSCLLTQALMPLVRIANLNDAIYLFDYITFSLTCGLRTVYLIINLKNLIFVDIANVKSNFVFYLIFTHYF